ncbi:Uncharacterised protein [Mycobacterium tuberculosis]|nr:Uncharacterised protein [Mycobacterium tuberculosis]
MKLESLNTRFYLKEFLTYWKTFQIKVAVIFWSLIEMIRFWKF